MYNAPIDSGNAGGLNGRVVMDTNSSNQTFLSHETGHSLGYGHSFDDSGRLDASWSAPGEYFDYWDIMSAMNVYSFAGAQGTSGPGMNAPYRARNSFIPPQRQIKLAPGASPTTQSFTVASLEHPEGAGYLMVRIGTNDADYFTVEYRTKDAWDQAIPAATVMIHEVKSGVSYLITDGSPYYNAQRTVGSSKSFVLNGRTTTVTVNSFAAVGFNASVTITY
jgi:M6 family metalloprotease-like protein